MTDKKIAREKKDPLRTKMPDKQLDKGPGGKPNMSFFFTKYVTEGKKINNKDFDKFWLSNYVRFDTCGRNDKKQAERKCSIQNLDYVLENKATIFDFENAILNDLKAFLRLLG